MFLVSDHPYLSAILALSSGIIIGWLLALLVPGRFHAVADDDHNDITGIGA